jgi:uncharacterized membrane protein YgcG
MMKRILRHLLTPAWRTRHGFPPHVLRAMEQAIRTSEATHGGEIRFAIEAALDLWPLLQGQTARARAIDLFSQLRVWDTDENNGVLIYLLLADRDVEIVADRGAHARINPDAWEAVCREMETAFRAGNFADGSIAGIKAVGQLLARHYPRGPGDRNELSNKPVILR